MIHRVDWDQLKMKASNWAHGLFTPDFSWSNPETSSERDAQKHHAFGIHDSIEHMTCPTFKVRVVQPLRCASLSHFEFWLDNSTWREPETPRLTCHCAFWFPHIIHSCPFVGGENES